MFENQPLFGVPVITANPADRKKRQRFSVNFEKLSEYVSEADYAKIVEKLKSNKNAAKTRDISLFSKVALAASTDIFKTDAVISQNVTNVKSACVTRPTYIDSITMKVSDGATVNAAAYSATADKEVANGEFSLIVNDQTVIATNPVSIFEGDGSEEAPADTLVLQQGFWIMPEKPIKMEYKFPGTPSTNKFIFVSLNGIEIVL